MYRSPFVLGVADLLGREASPREVTIEQTVDWGIEMSRVAQEIPILADLRLHPLSGGVAITGSVAFTTSDTCFRCLDEFATDRRAAIGALFDTNDDDDESYPLDGDDIDVEQLLRDEILLSLPIAQECGKDTCAVVTSAQIDLNTDNPGEEGDTRSPFAVLKDLLEPGD
ncbi:MAG: YceD family protein [Actinomycetia bacterium]|nr:YceD family protein [Actinomycetes bacterium]